MKKYKKLIILFWFFFSIFSGYSRSLPSAEIPMGANKFESIKVTYKISGKYQTGTEEFIQKGDKTYRKILIETKIMSNIFRENTLEIDDGVTFYRINLINKSGIKLPSLNKLKKEMITKNPQLFQNSEHNPLKISPKSGLQEKKESVLGKECNVYLNNNKLVYIWEDIILQEIWEVFGKIAKTADNLEVNIPVEENIFFVPKNIKFDEK